MEPTYKDRRPHAGGRNTFPALLLAMVLMTPEVAMGQFGSGDHQVTVSVGAISLLQVSGGAVNLNVTSANVIAGQDQMTVSNTSTSLLWGTNSSAQKVTVQTSLGAPVYMLRLLAQSPTAGTSAGERTLSTTPGDLLLNIGRTSGNSILRYTAVALASQGTGTENHLITFTMVAQ